MKYSIKLSSSTVGTHMRSIINQTVNQTINQRSIFFFEFKRMNWKRSRNFNCQFISVEICYRDLKRWLDFLWISILPTMPTRSSFLEWCVAHPTDCANCFAFVCDRWMKVQLTRPRIICSVRINDVRAAVACGTSSIRYFILVKWLIWNDGRQILKNSMKAGWVNFVIAMPFVEKKVTTPSTTSSSVGDVHFSSLSLFLLLLMIGWAGWMTGATTVNVVLVARRAASLSSVLLGLKCAKSSTARSGWQSEKCDNSDADPEPDMFWRLHHFAVCAGVSRTHAWHFHPPLSTDTCLDVWVFGWGDCDCPLLFDCGWVCDWDSLWETDDAFEVLSGWTTA